MIGTKIISGVDASREEKLGPKTGNRVVAARLYYSAKDDNELLVNVKNVAGEMYQNPEFMTMQNIRLLFIIMAMDHIWRQIISCAVNLQQTDTLWSLSDMRTKHLLCC